MKILGITIPWIAAATSLLNAAAPEFDENPAYLTDGQFEWRLGPPLVFPAASKIDHYYSVKDPSVVQYENRWHLFCTVRGEKRSHQIEYLTFEDWDNLEGVERRMLAIHPGFYCAPQVFYFRPQRTWYLICQASDPSWDPPYQPAFATTRQLADPDSWSSLQPLGALPADGKRGLDFWIIADDSKAHLFFTTLDGRMWREETALASFPHGWSKPDLAIQGDIFEASHTYRLPGMNRYLTMIEAQHGHGWRYFKAYVADRLEGPWIGLADSKDKCFASIRSVDQPNPGWTDAISHGELLRSGFDEKLQVDPSRLRCVIQGALDKDRQGKPYGSIPWRLGLMELITTSP